MSMSSLTFAFFFFGFSLFPPGAIGAVMPSESLDLDALDLFPEVGRSWYLYYLSLPSPSESVSEDLRLADDRMQEHVVDIGVVSLEQLSLQYLLVALSSSKRFYSSYNSNFVSALPENSHEELTQFQSMQLVNLLVLPIAQCNRSLLFRGLSRNAQGMPMQF